MKYEQNLVIYSRPSGVSNVVFLSCGLKYKYKANVKATSHSVFISKLVSICQLASWLVSQ